MKRCALLLTFSIAAAFLSISAFGSAFLVIGSQSGNATSSYSGIQSDDNAAKITNDGFFTAQDRQSEESNKDKKIGQFIIQLDDEPIAKKRAEIQKEVLGRIRKKGISAAAANGEISARVGAEETKIENAQKQASGRLASLSIPVKGTFNTVFNGMTINATEDQLGEIRKLPGIKAIYPDKEMHVLLDSSVPRINATEVWKMQVNGTNVTGVNVSIAIIDTGIDYTHPDLGNCTQSSFLAGNCSKVVGGFDFVNNDSNPMDDHGHGTHCAGIATANGTLKGVAPGARLLGYKAMSSSGTGLESNIILAIERALNDSADIISLSIGGSGDPDDALSQAVDNAATAGVVVVVAAGNDGPSNQTIGSPGTSRRAITVGASDSSWDILQFFSSRGPVIWQNGSILKPDILAPGYYVNSTVPYSGCTYCSSSRYMQLSGTSMATPHVAGAAALLLQEHPGWNNEQVRSALLNTAKRNLFANYLYFERGLGRLDALAAANYNATDALWPQSISFGIVDLSVAEWNATAVITLTNYDTVNASYNTTLGANQTGVAYYFPPNLTIGSNSNTSFSINVSVNNSVAPFMNYFNNLTFSSPSKNMTIPIWFLKEYVRIFIEQNITRNNTDIWAKAFGDLTSVNISVNSTAVIPVNRADGSWRGTHSATAGGSYVVNISATNILGSTLYGNATLLVDRQSPRLILNDSLNGTLAIINISSDEDISQSWSPEFLVAEGNETIKNNLANVVDAGVGTVYVFYVQEDDSTGAFNKSYWMKYRKFNVSASAFEPAGIAADGRADLSSVTQEINRSYIGYTLAYDLQPQVMMDRENNLLAVQSYETNNNFCGVNGISLHKRNQSGSWEPRREVYSVDKCTNNYTLCLDPSIHQDLWCDEAKDILGIKAVIDGEDRIHIFWQEVMNLTKIINFTGQVITSYTQYVSNSNQTLYIYDVFYEMIDSIGTVITNKTAIGNATNLSSFSLYDAAVDVNDNVYVAMKNTLSVLNTTDPLNSTLRTTTNTSYIAILNASSGNWSRFRLEDFEQAMLLQTDSTGRLFVSYNNNATNGQIYFGKFNFSSNVTDVLNQVKPAGNANYEYTATIDNEDNANFIFQAYEYSGGWFSSLLNYSRYSKTGDSWTSGRFNFEAEDLSEYLLSYSQFFIATPYKIAADSDNNLHSVWASDHYHPNNNLGLVSPTYSVFYKTFADTPHAMITEPNGTRRALNVTGAGASWSAAFNCTRGGTHIVYTKVADAAGNANTSSRYFPCNVTIPPGNSKPEAPSWISPENASSVPLSGLSLEWTNSSDADADALSYILLLDDDQDFSSPIILESEGYLTSRNISALDLLLNGTTYHFMVYANDAYQDGNATTGSFNVSSVLPWCGDGSCSSGESCSSCATDCGSCPPNPPPSGSPSGPGPSFSSPPGTPNKTKDEQKNYTILDQTGVDQGNKTGKEPPTLPENEEKKRARQKIDEIRAKVQEGDYEAMNLIGKAEELFSAGAYSDAYKTASEAEAAVERSLATDRGIEWSNVIMTTTIIVLIIAAAVSFIFARSKKEIASPNCRSCIASL